MILLVIFLMNFSILFSSVTAGLLPPDSEREAYWHVEAEFLQV